MTFDLAAAPRRVRPVRQHRTARQRNRAVLESLEQRVLLTAATGHIDIANRAQIIGWAFDADTPATSITVQVTVDGSNNNITASLSRPDLAAGLGSANHGFIFNLPALSPGTHHIVVSAADSQTGTLTAFSTFNLTNPGPTGSVDSVTATSVSGWAFDADNGPNPVTVRIDSNGSTVATVSANAARSDLTAFIGSPNHGFSVTGSFGVVDVYGIDVPTGTATLIGSTSVKAIGSVDVLNTSRVSGWAWTPDLGSTPVTIEVDVDGAVFQTATANTSRPDIAGVTGSANNGFNFTLNPLTPGTHTVQVFALDSKTTSNNKVLLRSAVLTNHAPQGSLDIATQTTVTGWVFDADSGATPIGVDIKVDGVLKAQTLANAQRPDLAGFLGSTAHGYSLVLNGLSSGPHKIEAFAIDTNSGAEVSVGVKFINNTLPFGSLDTANLSTISGWAFDPNTPTSPVNVVAVLDGVRDVPQSASNSRPDLVSFLGSANHGFSFTTPTHLAGTHTLSVIAIDTFSGQEVTLGTRQFTNQAPRGSVDLYSATTVSGWAQDPDAPTTSITMLIRIDGVITQATASVNRPDLTGFLGSPNHGFVLNHTALAAGKHFIEVFGVDPATGVSTLIGSRFITV